MAGTLLVVAHNRKIKRRGCTHSFPFFTSVINQARPGYMLILPDVFRNLFNSVKTLFQMQWCMLRSVHTHYPSDLKPWIPFKGFVWHFKPPAGTRLHFHFRWSKPERSNSVKPTHSVFIVYTYCAVGEKSMSRTKGDMCCLHFTFLFVKHVGQRLWWDSE